MKNYLALAIFLSGLLATNAADTVGTVFTNFMSEPYAVTVDQDNNYYLTEAAANRVWQYSTENFTLKVLVGGGWRGTNDGKGLYGEFYNPQGIVFARGGLFVADAGNHLIRFINISNATVSTVAGSLTAAPGSADGLGRAATFNSPAGLAADTNGNIYIADQANNAVRKMDTNNNVTTLGTAFLNANPDMKFYRPAAVTVDDNGLVYVADAGKNSIKVILPNGAVEMVAGSNSRYDSGMDDSVYGAGATFNTPSGLFWLDDRLIVSDTGNGLLRIIATNASYSTYSVTTFIGTSGGLIKPMGIIQDLLGSYLIADMGFGTDSGQLRIIPSTGATQTPVPKPAIGFVRTNLVETPTRSYYTTTIIYPGNSTFNNDMQVVMTADLGTEIHYTIDGTTPTQNSPSIPNFHEGDFPDYKVLPDPVPGRDSTFVISAIATAPGTGRRPSAVDKVVVHFKVATPSNPDSDNMNNFAVSCASWYAQLYYTTDDSDPSPANGILYIANSRISVFDGTIRDVHFKMRGFRDGYEPSGIMSNTFLFANLQVSTLGVNTNYVAGIGSTIVVPVSINLAAGDQFRSLQYRVEITSGPGAPLPPSQFRSLDINPDSDFIHVGGPAAPGQTALTTSYPYAVTSNNVEIGRGLVVTAIGTNANFAIVSNSVVSLLAVPIPPNAKEGDTYRISVSEPSGTFDAARRDILLWKLSDVIITVANLSYLVGDSLDATWYNAGDFGDGNLLNNDVNAAFYASLGVRVPFDFTDVFDAMDAFPLDTPGIAGGDGQIRYLDWQTILRRSLRLDTNNWKRAWTAFGGRTATSTTLPTTFHPDLPAINLAASVPATIEARPLTQVNPGQTVSVPVYVNVPSGAAISGLQLMAKVGTGDGTPALTQAAEFMAAGTMPTVSRMSAVSSGVAAWDMGSLATPLRGSNLVGFVRFTVPTNALPGQAYTVYFTGVDGAADWSAQADFAVIPASVWVRSDAQARLPEVEWMFRHFGSLTNKWANMDADPDGDGVPNLQERMAGTDPTKLRLVLEKAGVIFDAKNGLKLRWFGKLGTKYTVEKTTDLSSKKWTAVASNLQGRADIQEFIASFTPDPATYYRVRLQLQP